MQMYLQNNKIYGGSMKNFVITTVSVFALLGNAYANVDAQEKSAEMKEAAPAPAHEMAGKKAAHHGHRAHHGHHKHHGHHAHQGHRPLAVYVNYPPVSLEAFSACPCEYYQGNQEYQYVWHEGYFWYPHPHAGLVPGYTPPFVRGQHWYASRSHPHQIYVDRQDMSRHDLMPVHIGDHPQGAMHRHGHPHHKGKKAHHAGKKMTRGEGHRKHAKPMEEVSVEEMSVEEVSTPKSAM
jgi:hypothetical protein